MIVLAWKQGSRLAQGRAVGDLYLRIVGSARQGQIVRLSAPKCTIGSAEGCTLRLRAAGVRPLHCIILRGSRGTAIRSWARDTRLNGQPFGDSLLVPGDRLTVGPIEFDVLDATGSDETMPSQNDRSTIVRPSSPSRQSSGRQAHVARQRVRKLVAAIKQLRAEIALLQSRPTAAPRDTDTSALESRRFELEQRIAEFEQERDKWEATLQGTQANLEARDRKLADELAELAAAREGLSREREAAEELRVRESLDQNEQAENRRRVQEELRLARDAFEQQRGAWAMENAQLHTQLENEQAELLREREEAARILREVEQQRERRQLEFQSQLEELEQEQQDWNARRAAEESRLATEQSALERKREETLRETSELRLGLEATQREREQIVADLASQRQLWAAERTQAESHLEIQTSLVARQQAELSALRDELDDIGRQTQTQQAEAQARQAEAEARQAQADRAAAEALAAAEELRQRAADLEARQAAAWRELDRERTQVAALASIRSEPLDDLHVRATELEAARRELERQSEVLTAERTDLERQAAELAQREARLTESASSQEETGRELDRIRSELEADRASIDDACRAVQQQAEVLEAQRSEIVQQREAWEQTQAQAAAQADELAVSLASHATERAALVEARQVWEAGQNEAEERHAGRTAELDAREQSLATERAALAEERQAWEVAQIEADERLAGRTAELEASLASLATERAALAEEPQARELGPIDADERLAGRLAELDAREQTLATERAALADERQAWEVWQTETEERLVSRTAELADRERALASEAASTETVVNVPPAEDRDWDARRTQFEQERQAWHDAREQGDAEYCRQLQQFEEQLETLRTSETQLESERAALAREREEQQQCGESLRELAAELEAKEKELFANVPTSDAVAPADIERAKVVDAQQAEIEQARQELDHQREELERQREELEAEHNHARARVDRQRTELEELRDELEEARTELLSTQSNDNQRPELSAVVVEEEVLDPTTDENLSPNAAAEEEDFVEVAEQDSAEQDSAEDEEEKNEEDDEEVELDEAPLPVTPSRSQRASTAASNSDEESIDDYMAALLDRMRGGKPPEVVVAPQPKRNKRKSDPVPAEERSAEDAAIRDVTSGHVVDMPMGAAELARRTAPVEKTDLTAMRELANTQASIAITRFGKKQLLHKAIRDYALVLLCVIATLFVLVVTPSTATVARTGSMLGIAAGIYWLFTGLVATQQWIAIGRRHKKGRTPRPAKCAENKTS